MSRSFAYDDDVDWPYHDDEVIDDDGDDLEDYIDEDPQDDSPAYYDEDIRDESIVPLTWETMTFGDEEYLVSNEGHLRKAHQSIFDVSYGYRVEGTPYRAHMVRAADSKMYNIYIHDIVWRAFNGDVPYGYAVRHIDLTQNDQNCYCNNLDNLHIVKLIGENMYSSQF